MAVLLGITFILLVTIERALSTFGSKRQYEFRTKKPYLTAIPILSYITICASVSIEYFIQGMEGFLSSATSVFGLLLLVTGVLLRRKSIGQFEGNWNIHIDAEPVKALVRTGPYRWIRHPYYLSVMLELFGFSLALNTYTVLPLILIVQGPLLMVRIVYEERDLLKKFSLGYLLYCYKTGALMPKMKLLPSREERYA